MSLIHYKINYRSRIVSTRFNIPVFVWYAGRLKEEKHRFGRTLYTYGDRPKGTPQVRPHDKPSTKP